MGLFEMILIFWTIPILSGLALYWIAEIFNPGQPKSKEVVS